jgi:spermidine synthase
MAGGAAGLGWEVLWQHHAALALGVSAQGAAIVLAATMAAMAVGALAARAWAPARPLVAYASLELIVAMCGLAMPAAFRALEAWDAAGGGRVALLVGIPAVILPPAAAMGATLPVLGRVGAAVGVPLSGLYAANALGAALGALGLAFVGLPALGVGASGGLLAAIDVGVALGCAMLRPAAAPPLPTPPPPLPPAGALPVAFLTGAAVFALEVAWFRALRAAFLGTTATFAILLAAVLLAVAVGGRLAPWAATRASLGPWLTAAGVTVLLAAPIVERMDRVSRVWVLSVHGTWLLQTVLVVGPPVALLAAVLPWLLDSGGPRRWGPLYAANTVGAVVGALGAGWVLLPALGFARTAWGVGAGVAGVGIALGPRRRLSAVAAAGALCAAVGLESGVGRTRIYGAPEDPSFAVLVHRETADHSISVVDAPGGRRLYLDGFEATAERRTADYMDWMGRLPMLLHPDPRAALVICFGTGRTADAVRQEGGAALRLDVVDVSRAVFELAPWFPSNDRVLEDPRVAWHVADGRAWLRRAGAHTYDVITLEPMPPTFAGVNALYSLEFYALLADRLRPGGVAAQWLPFHLVDPHRAASIVATVAAVFPEVALWVHAESGTGVVLARAGGGGDLGGAWPGLAREAPGRTLTPEEVRAALILDPGATARLAAAGDVITDDNQRLAVGADPRDLTESSATALPNAAMVELARRGVDFTVPRPSRSPALAWAVVLGLAAATGWAALSRRG